MYPARYEIRLKGRVSGRTLEDFGHFRATVRPVETVLRGRLPDQVTLLRLLSRVRSLGLELLGARQLPEASDPRSAIPAEAAPAEAAPAEETVQVHDRKVGSR